MPRTGTTFLQRKVFPLIENCNYYGIPFTNYNQAFQKMMYMDDSIYDEKEFIKEINSLEGENIILSNESLPRNICGAGFVRYSLFIISIRVTPDLCVLN